MSGTLFPTGAVRVFKAESWYEIEKKKAKEYGLDPEKYRRGMSLYPQKADVFVRRGVGRTLGRAMAGPTTKNVKMMQGDIVVRNRKSGKEATERKYAKLPGTHPYRYE